MNKPIRDYFRFPIARNCEAIVAFYGESPITQEAIDLFLETVSLMKDCYPKAEEPKPCDPDSSHPSTEAGGVIEADCITEPR